MQNVKFRHQLNLNAGAMCQMIDVCFNVLLQICLEAFGSVRISLNMRSMNVIFVSFAAFRGN